MNAIRFCLFFIFLAIYTPLFNLASLFILKSRPLVRYKMISLWAKTLMKVMPVILGIRCRVIGLENIPDKPCVIMSKHMSSWETFAFQKVFPPVSFVLKKELLMIPFFGWALAVMPKIAIQRSKAMEALKQLVTQGCERLKEGLCVVIFPEGTRVLPGTKTEFKSGAAVLAKKAKVNVLPVAHNAGEFWLLHSFAKRPGEIVISIGPVIDTSTLKSSEVTEQAQVWVEHEMQRLFPHHYKK